jgi:ParB family transcriptional regulator, chromosome partitioning protein
MPPRAKPAAQKSATPRKRKPKPAAGSVGLDAAEVTGSAPTAEVVRLRAQIEAAGGTEIAAYREPFGGFWVALAALPLAKVKPTPYQRELSKTHAARLATVIPKVGRFLDPVIAVPDDDGGFITPNGMHRLAALGGLGAKTIIALVMPEPEIAFRILALNTEKAHNLKDKALEVIRMARAIAGDPKKAGTSEADVAFELEQASLVTLGVCYETNARFSGGAYNSVVARTEAFATAPMAKSLAVREAHAERLLELDVAVTAAVARLKASGWNSGYLKPIVVARINPLRFVKPAKGDGKGDGKDDARPDFDKTIDRMLEGARKFDPSKIKASDMAIASAVGGSGDDDG